MGLLTTLKEFNIRFNPKPWANSKDFTAEHTDTVVKLQDTNFIQQHIEVTKKVDKLIEQMQQNPQVGKTDIFSKDEANIAPKKTTNELEKTVLRK
jgi:hypothetical protein